MWKNWNRHLFWVRIQNDALGQFFEKLSVELPYGPDISLSGTVNSTYTQENSRYVSTTNLFTNVHITITPVKSWKQVKCPPTDESGILIQQNSARK